MLAIERQSDSVIGEETVGRRLSVTIMGDGVWRFL
jgi:hypothetical protein